MPATQNTAAHTPEPWTFKPHGEQANKYWHQGRINAGELLVAQIDLTNAQKQGQANARRIVACVNACAGYRTEALESGISVVHTAQKNCDARAEAEKQRDALADALRVVMAYNDAVTAPDGTGQFSWAAQASAALATL